MRQLNGHEVAWIMGMDEDRDGCRILLTEELGLGDGGYAKQRVVFRHPDGKLYMFIFEHNARHGIYPCLERPEELTPAYEVEAVKTEVVTYRRVDRDD